MNENLIKAIADSVGETLLSERDRTSAGLAALAVQIKDAETALFGKNSEFEKAISDTIAAVKADVRFVTLKAAEVDAANEVALSEREQTGALVALLADQVKDFNGAFIGKNEELAALVAALTVSLKADLRAVDLIAAEAITESVDIKSRLSDLQARLASLATTDDLSSHVAIFETTRTELLGWIEDLKSATEISDNKLGLLLQTEVDELKTSTAGNLASFALKLNAFEASTASATEIAQTHFAEKFGALQSDFETKLSAIEAERSAAAASFAARLSSFSDEVAKLLDAVSKQDMAVLESGAALTVLEEQHAALAPEIAKAFAAIAEAKSAIEASASDIKSDIQAIRSGLEADAVTFAELAARYPEKGDKGQDGEPGVGIIVAHWHPGIYREGSIVQYDLGRYAKALRDTADAPDSDAWARLGTSGFGWKGVKREGEEYQDGDFFIDDGTAFLVVGGKARMFAKRGERGIKGDKGDKGDSVSGPAVIDVTIAENKMTFVRDDGEMFGVPLDALAPFIKTQTELAVIDALKKLGLVR